MLTVDVGRAVCQLISQYFTGGESIRPIAATTWDRVATEHASENESKESKIILNVEH